MQKKFQKHAAALAPSNSLNESWQSGQYYEQKKKERLNRSLESRPRQREKTLVSARNHERPHVGKDHYHEDTRRNQKYQQEQALYDNAQEQFDNSHIS